ncbi:MAG: hypothetical protein H7255_03380 [Ramlibacter sp.]|nr:hypothetical protein [Ramlibacter sp.]
MLPTFISTHLLTLHALVTVLATLAYVGLSYAVPQRRHPTAAIAWMLFIVLVPYVALPAFLTFGSRKLRRPAKPTSNRPHAYFTQDWAVDTLLALGQRPPAHYTDLRIHKDGAEAGQHLLALIRSAKHSIDICTFILGRDALGSALLDVLFERARNGVRVRLLLDGFGDLMAGRPSLAPLVKAGGAFSLFAPPWRAIFRGGLNLREHRKFVVTDAGHGSAHLWCGGRNLACEYFDGSPGVSAWRDLTFDLRGALVGQAARMFEDDWALANGQRAAAHAADALQDGSRPTAQLVRSGPDQRDDAIYSMLLSATYHASARIALVTPYFVPDSALLGALCLAARRGVAVDLVLPAKSNHAMSDLARRRALRALTQAGAHVWFAPGMLHAKLAIFDGALALAGSANLDNRSLFLNYETMVAFREPVDVGAFREWFEVERDRCGAYTAPRPGLLRDVGDGLLLWLTFQL